MSRKFGQKNPRKEIAYLKTPNTVQLNFKLEWSKYRIEIVRAQPLPIVTVLAKCGINQDFQDICTI